MNTTVFTPTQIHILKMFQYTKSAEDLDELKTVLYNYYSSKMKSSRSTLKFYNIFFGRNQQK